MSNPSIARLREQGRAIRRLPAIKSMHFGAVHCCLAILLLGFTASSASATITIAELGASTDPSPKYDRFLNDPAFIGAGFDWSGVGRGLNGTWATMISPNYFVSANHFNPGNTGQNTLRFYYNNNAAGPPETTYEDHAFTSVGSIAGSDLWLGKLTTAVSDKIAKYPIATLASDSAFANRPIYVWGLSDASPGSATSVRLGTNDIDAVNAFSPPPPRTIIQLSANGTTGYSYTFDYDQISGGGEALLQTGDSGAPNFYLVNGNLPALVGINWFVLENLAGSGSTFVPRYLGGLQAAMTDQNLKIVTEPGLKGDFSLDGQLTAADIMAMTRALTDLDAFVLQQSINLDYLLRIGDLNNDTLVTNADLQPLLNLLASVNGPIPVPEPATIVLMALCGAALLVRSNFRRLPLHSD